MLYFIHYRSRTQRGTEAGGGDGNHLALARRPDVTGPSFAPAAIVTETSEPECEEQRGADLPHALGSQSGDERPTLPLETV